MIRRSLKEMSVAYREHIKKLIDWLLSEVGSAGGDGDATWVVKNINLYELRTFIQDECLSNKDQRYWTVNEIHDTEHSKYFSLSNNQEGLMITTSEDDIPSWSQCTLIL